MPGQSRFDGYFLYHLIGQFLGKQQCIETSLAEFATLWSAPGDQQWPKAEAIEMAYLARWSQLLDAAPSDVIHAESVTSAIRVVIDALPDAALRGKQVVMAADSFPSLLLMTGMAEERGFALHLVQPWQGAFWVECDDMAEAITSSTGLVLLNWISSTSSNRCNAARLVERAHDVGALAGIDLTQGAGLLSFSVAEIPVDFAATTILKLVCGTPGAGILYARDTLSDICTPARRGWFSQENPSNWSLEGFAFAQDARKFRVGTPSPLACAGTRPALDWIMDGGADAMRSRNREPIAEIIRMIDELGLALASPREG